MPNPGAPALQRRGDRGRRYSPWAHAYFDGEISDRADTTHLDGYVVNMGPAFGMSGMGGSAALPVFEAFFYEGVEDYARTIVSFVGKGSAGRDPALIAVPRPKTRLLRALLKDSPQEITFADMTELGRNPARIIATIRRFIHAHPDTTTRFVGEPIWPGRSPAEISEGVLHEGLIGAAVAGRPVAILCPYDAGLDPAILEDVERTHTHVVKGGERIMSPSYDPDLAARIFTQPLPPVPDKAGSMVFHHGDLVAVRRYVEEAAHRAGFASERLEDLLLAVNEVATNTLVHVGSPGMIRVWSDPEAMELICDLCDEGRITDLLAGRSGPYPVAQRGWGLWMVNQVCDLVEMRSGEWGTNIRLHMRLL